MGFARIATGHYAQLRRQDGSVELLRGIDANKDQSYFLHALDQQQLAWAEFPVGHLLKPEVRRIASEAGLPTHAKRDSTGICFIGERNFDPFIARYLAPNPGPMRTPEGRLTVGEHRGLQFYTLRANAAAFPSAVAVAAVANPGSLPPSPAPTMR